MADDNAKNTGTAVNKQDRGNKQLNEETADFREGNHSGPLSVTNTVVPPKPKKETNDG